METTPLLVIGAGPIGIELAIALKKRGHAYLHVEKRQVGQTIWWYPPHAKFFSSADRIALAGVPIPLATGESKATREEYLAYLRMLVAMHDLPIRTYTRVTGIEPVDEGYVVRTEGTLDHESNEVRAEKLIFTTGDMHGPKRLGIPGEDLPHVSHYYKDAHPYFRRKLLIVGGRNSAVEAALQCAHAEVDVSLSYRRPSLPEDAIKYWLRPEIESFCKSGRITPYWNTVLVEIRPGAVRLRDVDTHDERDVSADFVLLMTGFEADNALMRQAGVELASETDAPRFDADTMLTAAPGVYVAGTATAGSQADYRVFIETSHIHVERIIRHLAGMTPPATPERNRALES